MLHKWLMLLPLPYVQPNAAFFFREKACACPTTRKARLVRTRREKDAAFGKYLHVGVAFLLPEPVFVICASGFCIQ